MPTNRLNVFLLHDSPELQPAVERCALSLHELAQFPIETIFLSSLGSDFEHPSDRPKKDLREGDVLIFISRDESNAFNESFVRAQCERAIERHVAIFPIIPKSHREQRRSAWRRQLIDHYGPIAIDYTLGSEALAAQASGTILDRLRLAQPHTDLFGRPLGQGIPGDALGLLLELAEGEDLAPGAKSPCEMAVKAIEARLLQTAIDALELASRRHVTSPVIPYWSARLRLSMNSKEAATKAVVEASRAARLTGIEAAPEGLARASWMLASRAAFMTGDGNAALAYLREAMKGPHTAADWIEVARRNAEMQHTHRALASFEEAFRLDVSTFMEAQTYPEFSFIEEELRHLNHELRSRSLTAAKAILKAEVALQEHFRKAFDSTAESALNPPETATFEEAASLLEIIQCGQHSFARQLKALSAWASILKKDANQHADILKQLERLPRRKPRPPRVDGWDALLLQLWPPYRRQWDKVEAAAVYQERLRLQLTEESERLSRIMPTRVGHFLEAVAHFEETVSRESPFTVFQSSSTASEGNLVVATESEEKWAIDTKAAPPVVESYAPETPPIHPRQMLFRLLREPSSGQFVASRSGVYFPAG